jgi:hypothetical protein
MAEQAVIICLAWEDATDGGVPGSQIRWCSLCGSEISVSPDGLAMIDRGEAKPACTDCGIGLMDLDEPDEVISRVGGRDVPIPGDLARAAVEYVQEHRDRD